MKRKVARLRLSPNEEARLVREEYERRRKLRIQQVREQQRDIALHIRREVERRRQHELEQLGQELREDWECQQREKLNTLQKLYEENLKLVGQGHRSAKENEPDLAAIAQKEEENHLKAEERYREALKELKSQRLKEHERQCHSINARKLALQTEKERAAKVANLPPPQPTSIQPVFESKKPRVLKRFGVSAFVSTHYHMPENMVDKEVDAKQPNAHEGAELEVRRLEDVQREEKRKREEQLEKARLRGKLALQREHLEQDRERLLVELEHMQQTDLLRRRQRVSQMPPQIFQPLYKRQEATEEFQREIEFAFEDMYTGERRVKGDLVNQLLPEPLPALSTASQDQELDVTLDEVSTPLKGNIQPGSERESVDTRQETSSQVDASRAAPRRALKKLLERVRSQRSEWTEHSSRASGADSPTVTDKIPERDSTIDTGSLSSGEKDRAAAAEPSEPPHPTPAALDPTEPPAAASVLLPDVSTDRIQKFTEEGKKKEEELTKEMQQQVALLQELEEQRARLEQVLLESQHERDNLKAAVIQEVPVSQPEEPVRDAGGVAEPVMPPGEDAHSRKIQEYQERLLEQNRIHQRSVEVARQRLEEYQRALQTRYSEAKAAALPGVAPLPLLHAPEHGARSVRPQAAVPRPTPPGMPPCFPDKQKPPLEMPTRYSGTLPSLSQPSRLKKGSSMLQHEEESISKRPGDQVSGDSAWLTDSIMERVTKHLPESVRPLSVTREPLHDKLLPPCQSASSPLQPASDSLQAVCTNVAPLVPGRAAAMGGASLHGPVGAGSLTSTEDDTERRRRELLQAQRWVLEQREAVELQQRRQEDERKRLEAELEQIRRQKARLQALIQTGAPVREDAKHLPERGGPFSVTRQPPHGQLSPTHQSRSSPLQPTSGPSYAFYPTVTDITPVVPAHTAAMDQTSLHDPGLTGSLSSRDPSIERCRQKLQLHKRVLEQREAVAVQQEEERKGLEVEEQRRRTPETPHAVSHTDAQAASEASSEVLSSEDIRQARLKLLASLLRAIEESNGGTLSHLEEPQKEDVSPQQMPFDNEESAQGPSSQSNAPAAPLPVSVLPSGFLPPPHPTKPPITRVRLGPTEGWTDQHELSVIPEVETPVNTSQVMEDSSKALSHSVDWEESRSTTAEGTLQTPSLSSSGRRSAQSLSDSRTSSERSFLWRERLLLGAESSPQSSEPDSRLMSSLSSDSGGGADGSGAAVASYRSTPEAQRPPDLDGLSSSTISTGSYVTTDPEPNVTTDKSVTRVERGQEAASLGVPSPSLQSSGFKSRSAAGYPGQAMEALFTERSIQGIIDKYTKELSRSLSSTGMPTDSGYSHIEESGPAVSHQSVCVSGSREEDEHPVCRPPPSHTTATQRSELECVGTLNPALENFLDEPSLADGQEQDSFRPLIGQPADQSSCLDAEHRDAPVEPLVGQPAAHSSAIGQLPGQPVSASWDQGGWDSTVTPTTSRLSQQPGSPWLSGGRDLDAGQVAAEQSTTWMDGGQEESQMRPLVGEWDESAAQRSGSSGEGTRVGLGVSTESDAPSHSEVSQHSGSVPGLDPQTPRSQTSPTDLSTERTEGADSFHPLLAEVTHNETLEPSITFQLPENTVPDSPEGQETRGDEDVPAAPEELEANDEVSEFERSLEQLRSEEPTDYGSGFSTLRKPFSQHHPSDSILGVSPTLKTEVERAALSLSNSEMCEDTPPNSEWGCSLRSVTVSEKISVPEAASEKGILEQSEITLLSLTDSTLQDKDTITDEEDKYSDEMDERERGQQPEVKELILLPDETPSENSESHPATLLEFEWGPGDVLQEAYQQKRHALLQRSSRRVEEMKAKKALNKNQAAPEAREPSVARDAQPPVTKRETEPRLETDTESKGSSVKQPHPPPSPVRDSRLHKVDEIRTCTTEQRKLQLSEMHQRTQRLYEQLEEVKLQESVRSRQEAYAKNRLRAKEFHKKTLQKLRIKQTLQ